MIVTVLKRIMLRFLMPSTVGLLAELLERILKHDLASLAYCVTHSDSACFKIHLWHFREFCFARLTKLLDTFKARNFRF